MRVLLWSLHFSEDGPGDFYPKRDAIEHTYGADCICGPRLVETDAGGMYRHVPLDKEQEFAA